MVDDKEIRGLTFNQTHLLAPEADNWDLRRQNATVDAHLEQVRRELPDAPDPESYTRRFTLLTLTRVGKDLALYRYAAEVRNDERYLPFVPNCVRYLRTAAQRAAWSNASDFWKSVTFSASTIFR